MRKTSTFYDRGGSRTWGSGADQGVRPTFAIILIFLCGLPLFAQLTPRQKQLNLDSFEKVWTTIRDKHWEKNPGGLDWQAIHEEYRPKVEKAASMAEARTAMREMLDRLKQTHFAIFPQNVYDDIDSDVSGDGSPGLEARVLDGQAVVVRVDPGSPAEKSGVKPGWILATSRGKDLAEVIRTLLANPGIHELALERALDARLTGSVGAKLAITFADGADRKVPLEITLVQPRGQFASFGNLPPMPVWFESKKIGNTGYIAFDAFLDLPRLMPAFGDAVSRCQRCEGLIIDLRGNPGGIGGMAMGMAGWLVDQQGKRLGRMVTREASINFIINPRADVFAGPLAILVDGSSASTSEIFAGGLKDLGRARIFGTPTAAAALPSVIEKLPNGDGFQYAMANYISEGGKPLEGVGVTPDVVVKLTRKALLAGHDPVIDAALEWIRKRK